MGPFLWRELAAAGLSDVAERALQGDGLCGADLARARRADLLLVAGLADAVRARFRGDEVTVVEPRSAPRDPSWVLVQAAVGEGEGKTGAQVLLEVALARLGVPASRALAVSFDAIGIELAQAALAFGADVLVGDLGGQRALPLLDGPAARQGELRGLCERAGRRVRFLDARPSAAGATP